MSTLTGPAQEEHEGECHLLDLIASLTALHHDRGNLPVAVAVLRSDGGPTAPMDEISVTVAEEAGTGRLVCLVIAHEPGEST